MSGSFTPFAKAVHARFAEMSKSELFVTNVGDLFDLYLAAYPPGTNPMFRKRTEYDCNCCKQFIRRLGGLVNIVGDQVLTVWEDLKVPEPFKTVAGTLATIVKNAQIISVFRSTERNHGADHNYDRETNVKWEHFHGELANWHFSRNPGPILATKTSAFQVMKRGLEQLQVEHMDEILELIAANGLYKGLEYKPEILGFKDLLNRYKQSKRKDLFLWANLDDRSASFRNTVIGTLFVERAEGKDLENAVKAFEKKVAPDNFKRPTAIITQSMIEKAVQQLTDLGLYGAVSRRYAKLSDVSVTDVLFVDNDTRGQMKDGITKLLEANAVKVAPNLKNAIPVTADRFVQEILPRATALEVLVENRHQGNFLSLTYGDDPARLFKWDNSCAWSYEGDVTDSVKQRVKAAGGNVNAKLRVSLSWFNFDDLDLHARTPCKGHIYFGNKDGVLDVDMNAGTGQTRNAVENLAFNKLVDGRYMISVNQFCRRETVDVGFAIEVEYDGVIHQYSYSKSIPSKSTVDCLDLIVKGGALVEIRPNADLKGGTSSQEKWGIHTETLTKVAAVMNSPNHWGDQAVGAKHLIFALKGCKNPGETRGIYNEFLRSDLQGHGRVFEMLGAKTKCKPSDEQISGVGFTQARGDSVTVVVDGKRAYTITF